MFRYHSQNRKYYLKGQSLITAGKINPLKWLISKAEAEKALKEFGVPIKEVKKIRCLRHQICISYWNINGKICCSFFSYRIFERWLNAVENLIDSCKNLSDWEALGDRIEYELSKFFYPPAMANQIWHSLRTHWYQLQTTLKIA
ncbi:hypothetical protein ACE1CI_23185 [Aerosakkonemataceae cyanobacterium BLCC-F50]|uniref:Uncharacterized protein n=1 Tax=Floridaenema flaviceps BLCC-F50 TaxID=3153642 RepID=A0ABV4XVU4_9CYAN